MGSVGCDCSFWTSRDGIFKTIEFIFSLLILILTSASQYDTVWVFNGIGTLPTRQMAAVIFVGSFCCITLLISVITYFFKLYHLPLCWRLPWKKMEMVYTIVCALLNFVGMAVAANSAVGTYEVRFSPDAPDFYELYTTVSIFSAFLCIFFIVHFLTYWRGSPPVSAKRQSRNESSVPS